MHVIVIGDIYALPRNSACSATTSTCSPIDYVLIPVVCRSREEPGASASLHSTPLSLKGWSGDPPRLAHVLEHEHTRSRRTSVDIPRSSASIHNTCLSRRNVPSRRPLLVHAALLSRGGQVPTVESRLSGGENRAGISRRGIFRRVVGPLCPRRHSVVRGPVIILRLRGWHIDSLSRSVQILRLCGSASSPPHKMRS